MAIDRFVRVGKLAMATIGTLWTVSNVQILYKQAKVFLLPSSYTFLFFHVILLSILFQYSSFASTLTHLAQNLHQSIKPNDDSAQGLAPCPPQFCLEKQMSRSFSEIWHRITMSPESEKGEKDEFAAILEQTSLNENQFVYSDEGEGEEKDIMVLGEDEKESMEDTWKAIMEGKKEAEERELKKSNTWGVTRNTEQMERKPTELRPYLSFRIEEENERKLDYLKTRHWGRRRMETTLSRDEINFRAEEFINKIKANIRLERLESYNSLDLIKEHAN